MDTPIRASQAVFNIALEISVILAFFYQFDIKRKPDLKGAVILWASIALLTFWSMGSSLFAEKGMPKVVVPFIHLSIFFLFYFVLSMSLIMEEYSKIMKLLIYPAIIASIFCILEKFGIMQFKFTESWINGVFGNGTDTAMYIAGCIPFVFYHKRYLIPLIFMILAILITGSASAIIGAVIAILFMFALRGNRILLFGSGALIILATIIFWSKLPHFLEDNNKVKIWAIALESWGKSPFFGWGLDSFKDLNIIHKPTNIHWVFTHNHYIWLLHSTGLIGLIAFVNFLKPIVSNFIANKEKLLIPGASLLIVAIMSFVSVPMRLYPIVIITALNLAILTREIQ
jgi:O-antigen ligase